MQHELEAYCRGRFPQKRQSQVKDLRRLPGGWENDVYAFDLEYGEDEDRRSGPPRIARVSGDYADVKSYREFHAMTKLYTQDIRCFMYIFLRLEIHRSANHFSLWIAWMGNC
jgi:hypothetical protein